jgi:predicted Rossmann fold nucleotide-binding protein DprA/Smf involved in DNA uptake
MIARIVSGGQSGVDRAALDAALAARLPCGGWCPRGRRAEDGPIPPHYPMTELATYSYAARTKRNVADSDATLVLLAGTATGGTRLTIDAARILGRPCLIVDPATADGVETAAQWIADNAVGTLNVAGPRESESPGIGATSRAFMDALIAALATPR